MKSNLSPGLLSSLVLASLAFAAPAQRGPGAGNPGNGYASATCPNAATAVCDGSGAGPNASCPRDSANQGGCAGTCVSATVDSTPLALGPEARAALAFQIDEERMARELYTAFNEKWGLQPFKMIPQSEARHESALRQLAIRAGLAAPSSVAGQFDSMEVQQRFDALLALGLESADSALRASAFVEEQDIYDLDTLIASTDSPDLKSVATALRGASANHLRAYVGTLQARGVTYEPKVIQAEEFSALVGASTRGMGMGAGRGQGFGSGRR